jgi:hypothetical protein
MIVADQCCRAKFRSWTFPEVSDSGGLPDKAGEPLSYAASSPDRGSAWHRIAAMPGYERGLYEVLITEALAARLRDLGEQLAADTNDLRAAEAADRIALHLGRIVKRSVAAVDDADRVARGIDLARALVGQIDSVLSGSNATPDMPVVPGKVLRAVAGRHPDGSPEAIPRRSSHSSTRLS